MVFAFQAGEAGRIDCIFSHWSKSRANSVLRDVPSPLPQFNLQTQSSSTSVLGRAGEPWGRGLTRRLTVGKEAGIMSTIQGHSA